MLMFHLLYWGFAASPFMGMQKCFHVCGRNINIYIYIPLYSIFLCHGFVTASARFLKKGYCEKQKIRKYSPTYLLFAPYLFFFPRNEMCENRQRINKTHIHKCALRSRCSLECYRVLFHLEDVHLVDIDHECIPQRWKNQCVVIDRINRVNRINFVGASRRVYGGLRPWYVQEDRFFLRNENSRTGKLWAACQQKHTRAETANIKNESGYEARGTRYRLSYSLTPVVCNGCIDCSIFSINKTRTEHKQVTYTSYHTRNYENSHHRSFWFGISQLSSNDFHPMK